MRERHRYPPCKSLMISLQITNDFLDRIVECEKEIAGRRGLTGLGKLYEHLGRGIVDHRLLEAAVRREEAAEEIAYLRFSHRGGRRQFFLNNRRRDIQRLDNANSVSTCAAFFANPR